MINITDGIKEIIKIKASDTTKLNLIQYFAANPSAMDQIAAAGNAPDYYEKRSHLITTCYGVDKMLVDDIVTKAQPGQGGYIFEKGIQIFPPKQTNTYIENVIRKECELFERTIKNCEVILKQRYNTIRDIKPEDLVDLKQTHGCDPSIAEAVFEDIFSKDFIDKYEELWDNHRKLGLKGLKREIIKAKTLDEA